MNGTVLTQVRRLCPSAAVIRDKTEYDHYWKEMLRCWKLKSHIRHFPGPNPMSIERVNFQKLQEDDYMVALKTDGVRSSTLPSFLAVLLSPLPSYPYCARLPPLPSYPIVPPGSLATHIPLY